MLKKWKSLSFNNKIRGLLLICTLILIVFAFATNMTFYGFGFYFIFIVMMYPMQNSYQARRLKEINYMWVLAEELNVSETTLSRITGIGIIDLAATKYEGNGVYFPPHKAILTGLAYLENLKNEDNL